MSMHILTVYLIIAMPSQNKAFLDCPVRNWGPISEERTASSGSNKTLNRRPPPTTIRSNWHENPLNLPCHSVVCQTLEWPMSKHVFLNKTTHCNFATKQPNCTKPRYIFQGSCTFAKSPTLGELHPPFLLYKLELQKIAARQHLAVCCSYMYKYYIYICII